MAMMALGMLGPSMALIVSASSKHGKAQERVDQSHERIVDAAAVEAGRHPNRQPKHEAHQHRRAGDSERGSSGEHHAIEEVTAKLVRAEPMELRRRPEARRHGHPRPVIGGNDKRATIAMRTIAITSAAPRRPLAVRKRLILSYASRMRGSKSM
jgi:hypothetical protein